MEELLRQANNTKNIDLSLSPFEFIEELFDGNVGMEDMSDSFELPPLEQEEDSGISA